MNIIDKPYDLGQLMALSRDGREQVSGIVAVPWHELLHREAEAFEESMSKRVTGSKYGLADMGIKLVGMLGEDLLLEVGGDVSMLLSDYEAIMASEQEEADEHDT